MVGFYMTALKAFINQSVLENGIGDTIQMLVDQGLSKPELRLLGFSDEEISIAGVK